MKVTDQEEKAKELSINAIDFHCHGVGLFDFTEISSINLQEIEDILAERQHKSILTVYLPHEHFDNFFDLIENFHYAKQRGELSHIVGIGLEGPLLASHGGTPHQGVWMPTKQQWEAIASAGKKGLVYTILSPDASFDNGHRLDPSGMPSSIFWVTETLLNGGVLPAPGHFTREDPIKSSQLLQAMFDIVEEWGQGPTMTDHLFNDMPRNFKHAWRTREERLTRDQDIAYLHLETWNLSNLDEKLGPVPATIIRNAKRGLVKACQNFDGEHVDLAIVKKAVELIGAENMLMMTDSIESKRLAGRALQTKEDTTLLYQDEGIVAAGSQGVIQQIQNMLAIGLTEKQIKLIVNEVPSSLAYKCKSNHAEVVCL